MKRNMALKAYEDACTRAELFGQPLPDKEDFLAKHKHLDVTEFEEVEIENAENTAMLDEDIKQVGGALGELNTILTSTQTKINRLKGVCGSLTSFFRVKLAAKDNLSYSSEPSYIGQTNYDKDYVAPKEASTSEGGAGSTNPSLDLTQKENPMTPRAGKTKQDGERGDINSALRDLDSMKKAEETALLSKATAMDIGKQMTSQFSRLDAMLGQAERAESSLQHQNKQMRSFLK